jgi:hypothetical protein
MTSDSETARPLSTSLVGTWELLSRVDHTRAGERRADPLLGADPVALLIYDRTGHFAAQFMKRDRDEVVAVATAPTASNNTRAQGGYDAYFGSYVVDDARSTVTQTLHGALSPGNVGQVLTREMHVDGDELTIQLDTESFDGEPVTRTLVWKRVG